MQKHLLKSIFKEFRNGGFTVRYWDGEEENYGTHLPQVKIIFHKPLPLTFQTDDLALAFGEAYMDEIIDIEGNFDDFLEIVENNSLESVANNTLTRAIKAMSAVAVKHQQKDNVQQHYDIGNDFFALWLDETMSYSCGYFRKPTDSLFQAQIQKIDHILKKLQIKPGERLLDIGSGWGWLIIRAAQQYGVKTMGITLSQEQYAATCQRISQLGLAHLVEVHLKDYLDLDAKKEQFDKIVSVGMFEHVGKDNLSVYMDKVNSLLKQGGLSLLHSIMGVKETGINTWIEKYIFPGGYIPSLREIIWLLPRYDFHLVHAESLRMHYAWTLDKWYSNYVEHLDLVEQKFGRRFLRMWKLYLRSCGASFRTSGLNVYQLLFSKGLNNSLEMTLDHIHCH